MEKKFIQIQLGLFFKYDFQGMPESASLSIKKQFGSDLPTQILGIPVNAPPEIPRVVANSKSVDINLSKNRIDFFSKKQTFIEDDFEKIWNTISDLSIKIGRVGVVVTNFKVMTIDEFKNIFNKDRILSLDPREISVRFNEKKKLGGFQVNNSQMYVTGFIKEGDGTQKNGIIITRDINTQAEDLDKNTFEKEILKTFIDSAILEADETVF